MKYVNQLEYEHIPYPTRVKEEAYAPSGMKSTVRSSGCGLCSVCMAIDIITDTTLDIEECVKISCDCVANHARGTDMNILGPVIAEKFDIEKRVYVAEINLHLIPALKQEIGAVKALPRFPAVSRDLALVMDESVEVGPLMAAIRA